MQYLPTARSTPSSADDIQDGDYQSVARPAGPGSNAIEGDRLDSGATTPFSRFYDAEYDGQVRRAYLLLGSSTPAHDIVTDAFVQILQRWESIGEPGPYLNRCVLNGCRDAAKRTKREALFSGDRFRPPRKFGHGASGAPQPTEGDSSDRIRRGHTSERPNGSGNFGGSEEVESGLDLAVALLQLPFRQRAAVVLRFYTGATENEIAESLGCRPGTVGSLIHRGLATLRTGLTP